MFPMLLTPCLFVTASQYSSALPFAHLSIQSLWTLHFYLSHYTLRTVCYRSRRSCCSQLGFLLPLGRNAANLRYLNSLAATTRKGGMTRLPGDAPRPARMRVASLNCSTLMGVVTPAITATSEHHRCPYDGAEWHVHLCTQSMPASKAMTKQGSCESKAHWKQGRGQTSP